MIAGVLIGQKSQHDPRGFHGSFELLAERGQQLQWRDYPMGHEVCDEQIDDIRNWLTERLPEQSSHG